MTRVSCWQCIFWRDRDRELGECHRRAPRSATRDTSLTLPELAASWPTTWSEDFCGEGEALSEDELIAKASDEAKR
jgi:hypothetical protein